MPRISAKTATKKPKPSVAPKAPPKIKGLRTPKATEAPKEPPKKPRLVSAGNNAAEDVINPVHDPADPPVIETEAPMPTRRTRTKRPPEPERQKPEPEEDDREKLTGFGNRATRRTRMVQVKDRPEQHDAVESGSRFVRMLNRDRRVVGVIANFVPERLTEGYRFIEGEPTIPTRTGEEEKCPGVKTIRARDYDYPVNIFDAIQLWRDAMLDDLETMPTGSLKGRSAEGIVRKLTSILDDPSAFGMVYGVAPTGKISEAIGYKN